MPEILKTNDCKTLCCLALRELSIIQFIEANISSNTDFMSLINWRCFITILNTREGMYRNINKLQHINLWKYGENLTGRTGADQLKHIIWDSCDCHWWRPRYKHLISLLLTSVYHPFILIYLSMNINNQYRCWYRNGWWCYITEIITDTYIK